jgi:hypothetical protein
MRMAPSYAAWSQFGVWIRSRYGAGASASFPSWSFLVSTTARGLAQLFAQLGRFVSAATLDVTCYFSIEQDSTWHWGWTPTNAYFSRSGFHLWGHIVP